MPHWVPGVRLVTSPLRCQGQTIPETLSDLAEAVELLRHRHLRLINGEVHGGQARRRQRRQQKDPDPSKWEKPKDDGSGRYEKPEPDKNNPKN